MQRSVFELGEQRGQQKLVVRKCEGRLGRPLTEAERTTLVRRIDSLGADRVLDVTYELAPDALAAWLANPAAT